MPTAQSDAAAPPQVRAMPDAPARARRLRAANFGEKRAAAVAANPSEGDFWQVCVCARARALWVYSYVYARARVCVCRNPSVYECKSQSLHSAVHCHQAYFSVY